MRCIKFSLFLLLSFLASFAETSKPKTEQGNNGRFVIIMSSLIRADKYLLDTQTGRVWEFVADEKGRTKLQFVSFIHVWDGGDTLVPETPETVDHVNKFLRKKTADEFIKKNTRDVEQSPKQNEDSDPK